MKKYISIFMAVIALTGCKKQVVISDHPFTITIDNPSTFEAWIDVIPETNDFAFTYGHVTKETGDSLGDDGNFIRYIDNLLREDASAGSCHVSDLLYRGAWKEELIVDPGTEYYAYAIPYDDSGNPIVNLTKVYFKTVSAKTSDIKFDVDVDGSVIHIRPKDDCKDTYFWDYEDCTWVDSLYTEDIVEYYKDIVYFYKYNGFFPHMLSQGDDANDMADWYGTLDAGDRLYLFVSGYDGIINSTIYSYLITYKGKEEKGEVVPLKEYPLDNLYTKSTFGKEYSCDRCRGGRKLLRRASEASKPGDRRHPL